MDYVAYFNQIPRILDKLHVPDIKCQVQLVEVLLRAAHHLVRPLLPIRRRAAVPDALYPAIDALVLMIKSSASFGEYFRNVYCCMIRVPCH
jgi:hypothetical protein